LLARYVGYSLSVKKCWPTLRNVAAAGMAERAGRPIGFMTFLKVGVPATLVSMLLATGYIALRYL